MHFWKSSSSKPKRKGRRPDGQPGLTFLESDRMPIHDSYWKRHRGELIVCALGGLGCLLTLLTLIAMFWASPGPTGFIMGPALPLFFCIATVGLVASICLPVRWYLSDRRMEKILEEQEDIESPDVVLSDLEDTEETTEEQQVSVDSPVEQQHQW